MIVTIMIILKIRVLKQYGRFEEYHCSEIMSHAVGLCNTEPQRPLVSNQCNKYTIVIILEVEKDINTPAIQKSIADARAVDARAMFSKRVDARAVNGDTLYLYEAMRVKVKTGILVGRKISRGVLCP